MWKVFVCFKSLETFEKKWSYSWLHSANKKSLRGWAEKVLSLAISGGLVTASHSLALSHYWPTQGLLAAEFPPWPITPRLSQPDPPWLPKECHIDADLSADAGSTWTDGYQGSHLQAIQQNLPPSSWITRACQSSRRQLAGKMGTKLKLCAEMAKSMLGKL